MEDNINVVIVDSDITYRELYMDGLKTLGVNDILSTSQPMISLDYIMVKHPKILIMDIVLPGYDSLEYIRTVRELSPETSIIVVTHFINGCIEKMCLDLGVVKYLRKTDHPDNFSFVISQYIGFEYIRKNYHYVSKSVTETSDERIDEILQSLNLPFHIKGTLYTKMAVKEMIKQNNDFESISITKEIYPIVAKFCNTTVSKVERGIRYCIEFILENETMNILSFDKYSINAKGNYRLSNSKFLISLANYVLKQTDLYANSNNT